MKSYHEVKQDLYEYITATFTESGMSFRDFMDLLFEVVKDVFDNTIYTGK